MNKVVILIIVAIYFICFMGLAVADVSTQQGQFIAAEKALKKNQYKTFLSLKKQLTSYSLYPYLDFMDLKKNMNGHAKAQVDAFLQAYPKTPLAYRIQNQWLRILVRQARWSEFKTAYAQSFQNEKVVDLKCYQAYALYRNGQKQEAFAMAETFWMVGRSQHAACDQVFKVWQQSGGITQSKIWQRFKLSMNNGKKNKSFANHLSKKMHKKNRVWAQIWLKIAKKPTLAMHHTSLKGQDYQAADILLYALKKVARKDVNQAMQYWQALPAWHQFSNQERQQAEKILATYMAYQKKTEVLAQMAKVTDQAVMDKAFRILRLRSALRLKSWTHVLTWIDALPVEEKQENIWQYWQARALEQSQHPEQAKVIYSVLSKKRDYYGFLAADRLHSDYSYEADFVPANPSLQKKLRASPTVTRIYELLALGRRTDAHREWWYLVNHQLDQESAEQAAKLANKMGWFHRAIMTMTWIKSWNDLNIRFPLEHKNVVLKEAKAKGLDPAWVFGVIRQESAFWVEARSSAGALGLMQLMPGTAKHIARTLKVHSPSKKQLFTPEMNIHMGTQYLRMMLDKLSNHPVLATAAYNAGPHRAMKWLPQDKNIDADIWVELIPFNETRKYVRRVMAYTVIYQHRLGQKPSRLSQHMTPISSMAQDRAVVRVAEK